MSRRLWLRWPRRSLRSRLRSLARAPKVLPPPPPPLLHGRARPAPPPRPVAARPRPRRALDWGRARVPASRALSESRTPSERKGEGAGAGGRRIGAAARPSQAGTDRHPAIFLAGAPAPKLLARRAQGRFPDRSRGRRSQ
ncbi:hypothetical protein H8959_001949 [Pygathrix nigripes]